MIRPMRGVAPTKPLTDFPYLVSAKIDGLRALVKDGVVYSKSLKPIPNKHVQTLFGHLHGADGELTVGPMNAQSPEDDVFDRSRGPIMSRDQEADFQFWIFDRWDEPTWSAARRCRFSEGVPACWQANPSWPHVNIVEHRLARTQERLDELLAQYLADGFEGAMLRHPDAAYKYGQSTEREGYLLKLKPFKDAEAVVLGVVEQMENTNAAERNELGYAKRSSAKGGKVGKGTFGAFLVQDVATGVKFSVGNGPGLTQAKRDELWAQREDMVGRIITYKYQAVGTQEAPRLPQFLRFRDPIDMEDQV